jgi:hypothetical protein
VEIGRCSSKDSVRVYQRNRNKKIGGEGKHGDRETETEPL